MARSALGVAGGRNECAFDLESEREPSVRAVLGHWMFGYMQALEAASVGNDIKPFAAFIADRV